MKAKALTDYSSYLGANLANKAKEVADKLTGSTKFPTPTPLPAALNTLADDYNQSVQDASSGSKYDIAKRNALRKQLLKALSGVAQYVNSLAEGDREAIVLTGLDANKDTSQPVALGPIVNFLVLQGNIPGQMVSKFRRPEGGRTYAHMYTPHPLTKDSVWTTISTTKVKMVFEGLEEGALYHFKVVATGVRDQKSYSDMVSQYILRRSMESAA